MLQHNTTRSAQIGKRAHIAHAAMMSLHAFCCGMPLLAMLAVAVSGAASGAAVFARSAAHFHALLHTHEIWILVSSAALVSVGGALELSASRQQPGRGFPIMFAVSVGCFLLNVGIIVAHRLVS